MFSIQAPKIVVQKFTHKFGDSIYYCLYDVMGNPITLCLGKQILIDDNEIMNIRSSGQEKIGDLTAEVFKLNNVKLISRGQE